MPSWKKIIVSGSDASLNSLNVANGVTGSLFGTASWAQNAVSASFAPPPTNVYIQGGNSFGTQAVLGTNDVQNLAFETSGSVRMIISGSNGNIGIGTISPSAKLHVSGADTILRNAYIGEVPTYGSAFTQFSHISRAGAEEYSFLSDNNGETFINAKTGNTIYFRINNSTVALINSSGSVGINTTTPNARLDVNGNAIITGSLTVITGSSIELQVTNTGVRLGNIITDTHTVTGSLSVSGSVTATNFTGSLFGTASWANNVISASYALTASTLLGTITSASYALTASVVLGSITSASYALSASYAMSSSIAFNTVTASIALNANTASHAINAVTSSYPITVSGNRLISAPPTNAIYFGSASGVSATNANNSNFLGQYSGWFATNASDSNFLGQYAGWGATSAGSSNFLGPNAGRSADNAVASNFIGSSAGSSATNAAQSNFFGNNAGSGATKASHSFFAGLLSGFNAENAFYSTFIGLNSGRAATSASYSTLLGYNVGYNIAGGALGIKSNNIIIGTNITMENGRQDSINFGGIIFATGSYSSNAGNPYSGSVMGRVGINKSIPNTNLDISGSVFVTGSLSVSGSVALTGSLFGTASLANTATVNLTSVSGFYPVLFTSSSNNNTLYRNAVSSFFYNLSTDTLTVSVITGSLFGTASWASNAISASWAPGGGGSGPIAASGSTLYSTTPSSTPSPNLTGSIFLGTGSGFQATFATYANFLGTNAGYQATSAAGSNFLGNNAGYQASSAQSSNFLGSSAGFQATNAAASNFLGNGAGQSATNASDSNFLGQLAGSQATNALQSNFIGYAAGNSATSASYSTLIGHKVGYNVLGGSSGIASNNIIIGTHITLENGRKDSINLGGIIFATGSYSTLSGQPYSGSVMGSVGINKVTPLYNLDISGSVSSNGGGLIVSGTLATSGSTSKGLVAPLKFTVLTGSYTLVYTDEGKMIEFNGSGFDATITIPANSSVAFPIGTEITIVNSIGGGGTATITGSAGVTVNSSGGLKTLNNQYDVASIVKRGTDSWYLFGNLG